MLKSTVLTLFLCMTFLNYSLTDGGTKKLLENPGPKSELLIKAIFNLVTNDVTALGEYITQKEGQGIVRYIQKMHMTSVEVMQLKQTILSSTDYEALQIDQKIDLEQFLTDVSYVRSRLSEFESMGKMHCRFALRDDPIEELPRDSVLKTEKTRSLLPAVIAREIEEGIGKRFVIGFCWNDPQNDPYRDWVTK